jgi:Zn-finger nucleic acid-binding protein
MVKNTTKSGGDVKIDDCYICGGKFLDYGELEKIRSEFTNDSARKEAAMQYLYNKVGQELHELNVKNVQNKANRNISQKLFYSILKLD